MSAKTKKSERTNILEAFKAGRLRVVTNVNVIALGFDFPGLDTVVLGNPTRSLARWYQQVGRIVRPHPGKPWGAVVDLVGSLDMFGHVEGLEICPGGKSGEQWTVHGTHGQLTNRYLE